MIALLPEKQRGWLFKKAEGLAKLQYPVEANNAILLTGANGAGKTVLIDSLAASAGLGGRYSSSETTYSHTDLDMANAIKDHGGAVLTADGEKARFDLVLRYRGEETRKSPLALDTFEDMMGLMGPSGSHGQVALVRLSKLLKDAESYLKKPRKRLLLMLDEPETAVGPDLLLFIGNHLHRLTKRALRMKRFTVVVATQSPFLALSLERAGATRLDLGGWYKNIDPFPGLCEHLRLAYREAVATLKETA